MSLKTNLSAADENDEQDARPQRFDQLRLGDEFISFSGDLCTYHDLTVTGQDRTEKKFMYAFAIKKLLIPYVAIKLKLKLR